MCIELTGTKSVMIIDCISDLHGHYPKLEGGDLLIVAGDLTARDDDSGYTEFEQWFKIQKYQKKIFIAGNHDNQLKNKTFPLWLDGYSEYLCDSGTEFEYWDGLKQDPDPKVWLDSVHSDRKKRLKIWGSPWTQTFKGMNPHCKAFTLDTEEELADKWSLIPNDIDILITHSPSFGNYDALKNPDGTWGPSVGSISLWMSSLVIRPKVHVFGHIHEGYGHSVHVNGIHLINASHVNERYKPVNKPVRIEL